MSLFQLKVEWVNTFRNSWDSYGSEEDVSTEIVDLISLYGLVLINLQHLDYPMRNGPPKLGVILSAVGMMAKFDVGV